MLLSCSNILEFLRNRQNIKEKCFFLKFHFISDVLRVFCGSCLSVSAKEAFYLLSNSKMFCKKSEASVFAFFNLVTLFIYVFLLVPRSVKCEDETTTITTATTETTIFETTTTISLIEEDRGIKSGKLFALFNKI